MGNEIIIIQVTLHDYESIELPIDAAELPFRRAVALFIMMAVAVAHTHMAAQRSGSGSGCR